MAPLWSSQPFTAIYIGFFIVKSFVQFPLRLIYYLPKQFRPLREWSLKTCVTTAVFRDIFELVENTHIVGTPKPDPKKAKDKYVLVEPSKDGNIYRGVLAPTEEIQPTSLGGLWFSNPDPEVAAKKGKVVIHFPSGAFIFAYDSLWAGQEISNIINKYMHTTKILYVQYRISTTDATRFPAAIQDALMFYHYVLQLGVDPKDIILSGDSAGGNVALALMRYLDSGEAELPVPGAAMVWSPWVHVTRDAMSQYSQCTNMRTDCLTPGVLQYGADAYTPKGGLSAGVAPYISPLHHPFKTQIPLFIHGGKAEAFYEEIKGFADEMIQTEGNRVKFHETEFAPHNILTGHDLYSFSPQTIIAATDALEFFRRENN